MKKQINRGLSWVMIFAMLITSITTGISAKQVEAASSTTLSSEEALASLGLVNSNTAEPDAYEDNTVGPYGNASTLINP